MDRSEVYQLKTTEEYSKLEKKDFLKSTVEVIKKILIAILMWIIIAGAFYVNIN